MRIDTPSRDETIAILTTELREERLRAFRLQQLLDEIAYRSSQEPPYKMDLGRLFRVDL